MTTDFNDFYEVLQISPNALPETIHRVYRLLAQHYHPDNKESGNVEMFNQVLEAYRVLSDPERRAGYDADHRSFSQVKWKIFETASTMSGIEGERRKRMGILSLLCAKRIENYNSPAMSTFELEELLAIPREHLELSLWYLKETGRISRSDNGRYVLLAKGLEMLEEHADTQSGKIRLLPAAKAVAFG
jgi:curved DNA-binding protein CbpA